MAIQRRSCWRRSRQKSHVLTVEFIDRAPTVRFYDQTGHISAAVCCETSLHALTDGRRHDHREGCEDAISSPICPLCDIMDFEHDVMKP